MTESSHPLDLMVRNLHRRSPLDEADRRAICDLPHQRRTLEAGTYVAREAEPSRTCTILLSGFAYRQKLTGDGARQIVSLHIPGDALDLQNLFLDVSDHSIQMLTRGECAVVHRADLQALVDAHSAIGRACLVKVLVEASICREWIVNIGRATRGPEPRISCANWRCGWKRAS